MKGPRDSDARGIMAQGRADHGAAAHARRAAVLRAELERRADDVPEAPIESELGGSVFARWAAPPARVLGARPAVPLAAGDTVLAADPPALDWRRADRIWLAGDNGAGKTTLLADLLAGAHVPRERLLVLPQELDEAAAVTALAEVRALAPEERGRVLAVVAALGVDPDRLLASRRPSPGEARKLRIATGLGRHSWGLVLDEPTNHLDLPSIERLERALAAYPGALLLVSHDAALAAACTARTWRIAGGAVVVR
jgi:ATPase subunit of ABC transporter with duplicated ATPase domains